MSALTNYAQEALTKAVLGIASHTSPGSTFLALHTADPTEVGNVSEASGGSYARQTIAWSWNAGTGRAESTGDIVFSMPIGVYTHFSVKDASSGGNTICKGTLQPAQSVSTPGSVTIRAGNLSVAVD